MTTPLSTIAALSLILAVLFAGEAAAGPVVSDAEGERVRAYWTEERMGAAEPVDIPLEPATILGPVAAKDEQPEGRSSAELQRSEVPDPSIEPLRAHGKVFFTIEGGSSPGDYLCSGTSVSSNNRSVVWTAGHCVYDEFGGGFATNWIFVPGYEEGRAPFGEWPARSLATTDQWVQEGSFKFDLGAAIVSPDSQGRNLAEVVGAREIGFDQSRQATYDAFGYPAVQPPFEFDGERMFRCVSPLEGDGDPGGPGPATLRIACDMNGGASGGGWVVDGSVVSVSSYKLLFQSDDLYGPYQATTARELYDAVDGEPVLCGGLEVTIRGTFADEKIVGTDGPDVIHAEEGDDVVVAGKGKDVVCGGSGDDRLKGNAGGDRLKGEGGDDALRGGKGKRDKCYGGNGSDEARACEKSKKVP